MKRKLTDILKLKGVIYIPEKAIIYHWHNDNSVEIYDVVSEIVCQKRDTKYKITKLVKE